jgi:hypothetical protein
MFCWNEINNQLHDNDAALIREGVDRFHSHKTRDRMQYGQIGAIVHFFILGGKWPIEILHLRRWMLISRP